jgi:hypothetical protein
MQQNLNLQKKFTKQYKNELEGLSLCVLFLFFCSFLLFSYYVFCCFEFRYPKRVYELQHRCYCLIPVYVALVLDHNPQLVSSAVDAFHYRDLNGMKVISLKTIQQKNETIRMTKTCATK